MTQKRILVVDDDADMRGALMHLLRRAGHLPEEASDGKQALATLKTQVFDAVLTDIRMPVMDGLTLLREITAYPAPPPVILLSAHADVPLAVAAMQDGAYTVIEKPFQAPRLLAAMDHAIEQDGLKRENRRLRDRLGRLSGLDSTLIGRSPAIAALREDILDVADTRAAVLVLGETGTGKEVVARALHDLSDRADAPFIAVNCAAVPGELFEASMFGHTANAFTGATRAAEGYFRAAHGGTLFLDEIGACPIEHQAKLLRVLEAREVVPVGATRAQPVDVRIVSATNEDLATAITAGSFREDLLYRLNTVQLNLPALRDRREDIPLLATHFLTQMGESYGIEPPDLDPAEIATLARHDWPGNVRELRQIAERRILSARRGRGSIGAALQQPDTPAETLRDAMAVYERSLITAALERHHGRMDDAARDLGIGRRTLNEKLVRLGLESADFRAV
ncbi:two-component system, NtrC family, C4-dicarboxylate transport response regulator DctD [Monaibacterium marinum]|uniref:Nif-specific regulatory protein n=1 Tax=Pontivivens marinum TaxID=1690039 RepID=A0A2C9CQD0_9RHOB|nr:sigma-54 dependent transcriptional regulator [Monaibacterium marinum]SOH93462.1 two-component system, NtrC family, C4-dicarboxylate transport response regulator DctD [Monaibacterium marinum]